MGNTSRLDTVQGVQLSGCSLRNRYALQAAVLVFLCGPSGMILLLTLQCCRCYIMPCASQITKFEHQ